MLKINNISKSYEDKTVLQNVTTTIKKGTSTVFVGESGSGKTTLAKILIGIEQAHSGEVLLDEVKLETLNKRSYELSSYIAYIFQDPYSALESEDTVKKVLEEPKRIALRNGAKPKDIEETLNLVDEKLIGYMQQKVKVLSGGQRQKLCIARALITKPKIIIADEATSMLDEESAKEIKALFIRLVKAEGLSLIYIAHEVDFEQDKWDNIVVLKQGAIVEEKPFKDFVNTCEHPYSKALVDAFYYFKK